jgi:hypothetical protein
MMFLMDRFILESIYTYIRMSKVSPVASIKVSIHILIQIL